jgi:hypothetical protein
MSNSIQINTLKSKGYGVALAKSGTTSLAALFGRYHAAHEFMRKESFEIIAKYADKNINEEFRSFVKNRDALGNFHFESSCFNVYFQSILSEQPSAKFIFCIRDCYSWIDSVLNMALNPNNECLSPGYIVLGLPFELPGGDCDEKKELCRNLLKYIDTPLQYWANTNARVLKELPYERTIIIRTHEIFRSIERIANFFNISADTLLSNYSHSNKARKKYDILSKLDHDKLKDRFDFYCLSLMEKFFPGYSLKKFLDGQEIPSLTAEQKLTIMLGLPGVMPG